MPRQREVVELYFFAGLTLYEIADRLGILVPSVSQHLFGKVRGGEEGGRCDPETPQETGFVEGSGQLMQRGRLRHRARAGNRPGVGPDPGWRLHPDSPSYRASGYYP